MPKAKNVQARRWTAADIPGLVACHKAAYPDYPEEGGHYGQRAYTMQLEAFPEGQFLVESDGQIIGYATAIIVQLDDDRQVYTYNEITGNGSFNTHDPTGDTLYGADIAIHPDFRGQGISKLLYSERKKLMRRYNLRRTLAYGRLPGFAEYAGRLTAQEYVQEVSLGNILDPALKMHLREGYTVRDVLLDFVWDDSSLNTCTLLEMTNPLFKPEKRKIAGAPLNRPVRRVRVCAAQYLFQAIKSWDDFQDRVEFFVDSADVYHCHYLVLPELFTAHLFSTMPNDWDAKTAIHQLADMSDRYLEMFTQLATKYRLYIIGGSTPIRRNDKLYNVAHLFTPTGHVYSQDKLHITPGERRAWDIRPGEGLNIFETPLGRIAIQVCYDIEFPETARLLTQAGAEIIFVPFSTDDRQAYHRVRYSAQARAIENSIFVPIAGNVGSLPNRTYLLNYGRSAIFTPCDFAFPRDGIANEAEMGIETAVVSDLDLGSLAQHRAIGATRPLHDRRPDLYRLESRIPINIIRTE